MKSNEILQDLKQAKLNGKEFIKWWRRENDFADYEMIDRFIERGDHAEIENYTLLDMDEMWELAKTWKSSGLRCIKSEDGKTIEWQHTGKDGQPRTHTCPYNAESLMTIFDVETRGDTIV